MEQPPTPAPLPPITTPPGMEHARRPPMIGWSAVVAVLLFLPVELYVGWDIARARASGPQFIVSYLMGRIIGALLFSTALAWVFYRLFRRSTRAGTITFVIVLGIALLSESHQNRLEAARRAAAAKILAEADADPLRFRDQPADVFDGTMQINYPAVMSMSKDPSTGNRFGLGVRDVRRNETAFDAIAQLIPLVPGDTLKAAEDRLATGFREKWKLADTPAWTEIDGTTPRAITDIIVRPDDQVHGIIWGIIRLDPQHLVLINFTIYSAEPEQRSLFDGIARRIVQSVTPTPTPASRPVN